MDHRAIVDVVCKTALGNLASEIGALLGRELTSSNIQLNLTDKATIFGDPGREKSALSRMDISGDRTDLCYLLNRIDSAITLGGTLIMLPEDQIAEQAEEEKLDGELSDAFSEIANIVAGIFTQAFVDKYPETIRFIKKTVEELVPTKIEQESDQPFPPGRYYVASCNLAMGDKELGAFEFIVPAAAFQLEEKASEEPAAPAAEAPDSEPSAAAPDAEEAAPQAPQAPAAEATPGTAQKSVFTDKKKIVDVIFNTTIAQIGEEIGALIGAPLKCTDVKLELISKADFFGEHCQHKVVMSQLQVSGDRTGTGFLMTKLGDAVQLGGTLIMLPEDKIVELAETESFEGEVADSYGEVANILAGSLTQVFQDRYPQPLRIVRTESDILIPTQVVVDSAEPFPEGEYYLASFSIDLPEKELDRMLLIFPAEIFGLDASQAAEPLATAAPEPAQQQPQPAQAAEPAAPADTDKDDLTVASFDEQPADAPDGPSVVLVISESQEDAAPFIDILSSNDHITKMIGFQDDIKGQFQQYRVMGVFLVMSQVSEKGFATAIKLQSARKPLPPVIFAGSNWTRSAVLRAVKYGAKDILLLPASNDEIAEKVSTYIKKAS